MVALTDEDIPFQKSYVLVEEISLAYGWSLI